VLVLVVPPQKPQERSVLDVLDSALV
jgi:hypothetical protein